MAYGKKQQIDRGYSLLYHSCDSVDVKCNAHTPQEKLQRA